MDDKKWVVMVHDGAYYGRDLVHELRKEKFPIFHITRSRKFWDKTFNIALKILRAKGSVFHVNVALQDAFITILTKKIIGKKPVIVNCHGTDLRTDLKDWKYRELVKFNVKNADYVFFANLDNKERALALNPTATWIPIPINLDIFHPIDKYPINDGKLKLFHPNSINEKIRGSLTFLKAFNIFTTEYEDVLIDLVKTGVDLKNAMQLCKKAGTLNKNVRFIPKISHNRIQEVYLDYDVTVGIFKSGIVSTVGLESWAMKRPILNYINPQLYRNFEYISTQTVEEIVEGLHKLTDGKTRQRLAEAGFNYVSRFHDVRKIAQRIKKIYLEFL